MTGGLKRPTSADPITAALLEVEEFCQQRIPAHVRDQIRLECSKRGKAITITERRPPWNPETLPPEKREEWSALPIAQLRLDPVSERFQLYFHRYRSHKTTWVKYTRKNPTKNIRHQLGEINDDPYCVFWG